MHTQRQEMCVNPYRTYNSNDKQNNGLSKRKDKRSLHLLVHDPPVFRKDEFFNHVACHLSNVEIHNNDVSK